MRSDILTSDSVDISTTPKSSEQPPSWYPLALPFSERRLLLLVGDVFLLAVAGVLAVWTWSLFSRATFSNVRFLSGPTVWLFVLAGLWLVLAAINECYDVKVAAQSGKILRGVVVTTVVSGLLYLLLFFLFERPPVALLESLPPGVYRPPRTVPVLFLGFAWFFVSAWRVGYVRLFTSPPMRRRGIVVGAGWAGRTLAHAVTQQVQDYQIVGFIDDDPAKQNLEIGGIPVVGGRHELAEQIRRLGADEIVLAITNEIHSGLLRVLMSCYERGITIKPMPLLYEEMLGQIPVEHIAQKWFPAPLWNTGYTPTVYRAFKRMTDVVVALVGLAFLGIVFPVIAAAIYLDSPGPLFYRQERVGKGGDHFDLIKFRSMIRDAEENGEAIWATRDDSRITRVGKFLRRSRLDEFPQLWNVLKGDMSIVGPRPERPQFVEQLQEEIPFYRARLSVKPGLTGWAQIKYRYGNTVEGSRIKLQYDLYYIKNRSVLLDLLIILRTVKVMLRFEGT